MVQTKEEISQMLNSEQNDEECDARDDDSSNEDGYIKKVGKTEDRKSESIMLL